MKASLVKRISNFIIDFVIIFIMTIIFTGSFKYFTDLIYIVLIDELFSLIWLNCLLVNHTHILLTHLNINDFYCVFLIVYIGYYLILETLWSVTIGKILTGTKILSISNEKPNFLQIVFRTLSRFIPFEKLSFPITKNKSGWHDKLSKTKVVTINTIK